MPIDPGRRSFVPTDAAGHFPLQNLPYGSFRSAPDAPARIGVAIGDRVLDLAALTAAGLLDGTAAGRARVFAAPVLNDFLALGAAAWAEARTRIADLLTEGQASWLDDARLLGPALVERDAVTLDLPVAIGDYTDFYASRQHATNVGTMFRGADNALLPNWRWVPIGYHGRASSVVVSGTPVRRPSGQRKAPDDEAPTFGPTRQLDFELELGFVVGAGNALGRPVAIADAPAHVFGCVLVNDWSARDIQAWEYVPLGPFLAKNFATSISPWVVPLDALQPYRVAAPPQEPPPLPYLARTADWALDIVLEVAVGTAAMRAAGRPPQRISRTNAATLYWDIAQQIAHHTSNGCNLRPGDLLASGTISGDTPDSRGSLLELSWRGQTPLDIGGEPRAFLEDGDEVVMTGWCEGVAGRVGFGEVRGVVG